MATTRSTTLAARAALALAALGALGPGVVPAEPAPAPPRTLVLVLDGVPFRLVERAVAEGAFAAWPAPARLMAPFPSMTNMSLTLMLSPLGVDPAPGYELQHYDWATNTIHGGGAFEQEDGRFPWREHVQVGNRSLTGKFGTYARPRRHFARDLEDAIEQVLATERDVVIAHVGATDALQHLYGDSGTFSLVRDLDGWVRTLEARHLRERGRPLRVVLLSDHGNSERKIRRLFGARKLLRRAGLRVRKRLEEPGDVVVGTFGVTGYAALYLDGAHAAVGAQALVAHPGMDLAAWCTGPRELRVVSDEGEALVRWRDDERGRVFSYDAWRGDPLELLGSLGELRACGVVDGDGFAPDEAWLSVTAAATYPDALRRLAEGLTGDHVVHHGTVLLSLEPGWAWGWKSAATFAWFRGGALEGTHGGLDHDSSVGFFLTDDASLSPGPVVRAGTALAGCLAAEETALRPEAR